jgi:peptidoglycan hydrolase-like protein with peptidoglycan-binding domain
MNDLINSRGSWDARYQDGDKSLSGLAEEVFVHHTVTAQLPEDAPAADEREQMRVIESIGQSRFGTGISYNVIVFPSGRAYQGVSWNRRGTHTGGRNSTVRSICFAGNYEKAIPTAAALATAAAIYAIGKGKWWRDDAPLHGHRDVSQTACPGKNLYSRLGLIRNGGADFVDNPIKPIPSMPEVEPATLKVDGYWGSATTRRLQQVLGTPVDGIVSSQNNDWERSNPGLTAGWDWSSNPNGSRMMSALQKRLGVNRDGLIGPNTIRGLQRHLGTPVDGVLSAQSKAIMALQRRLNEGKL